MKLGRREILEQLIRLGIRDLNTLKDACREFEAYWEKCDVPSQTMRR